MKIAMIGQKRVPSREGGIEVVVEELSVRMAELGHKVVCYNRRGHHVAGREFDRASLKEYKGVTIRNVFTIDKKGLAAITSSFTASLAALSGRFDVIHFHAEGPCAMLWIPHIFGIRTVATIHGLDHKRAKWSGFATKYLLFGEKMAVRYADEIIVLSKNVKDYFQSEYGRKTHYIPNGIGQPSIRPCEEIEKKWGLEKNEYILFLGRIVPEKGLEYLIKAFKELETTKKLVIAGGASDTSDFMGRLRQEAGKNPQILFTGFVQGTLLEELYSNAYVYVLPSDLEGMPMGLLEAVSYYNCCLTSDIKECMEVTGDAAFYFKKGDYKDLRDKLQLLCERVDLVKEYKMKVKKRLGTDFDWDIIVEKTLKLYSGEESLDEDSNDK